MTLYDSKPAYLSKGVIGGSIATLAGLAGLFTGYQIDPDTHQAIAGNIDQLVELGSSAAAAAGGLLAIYGRLKARQRIR